MDIDFSLAISKRIFNTNQLSTNSTFELLPSITSKSFRLFLNELNKANNKNYV